MKKLCAAILCILLCLTALPLAGVLSEETSSAASEGSSSSDAPSAKKAVTITVHVEEVDMLVTASVKDEDGQTPTGLTLKLLVDNEKKGVATVGTEQTIIFDTPLQAGDKNIVVTTEGSELYKPATAAVTRTAEEQLGFDFKEELEYRSFNGDTGSFSTRWNYSDADGADIVALLLGGSLHSVSGSAGTLTALLPDVPYGKNKLSYVFKVNGKEVVLPAEDLKRTGITSVNIVLSVQNGRITAKVTDSLGGPVPDYAVTLTVGSTTMAPQKTSAKGVVNFNVALPAAGTAVRCEAAEQTVDGVTYQAATGSLANGAGPTSGAPISTAGNHATVTRHPAAPKPPTTTGRGRTATTTTTYATIKGAGTTSVENDRIVVNVTFDEGVVKTFGLKNKDFEGKARFLLPKDAYAGLVQGDNGTLMMTARYSPIQVTDQQISAAVTNLSKYSLYHAENILRVTLDLALLFTNRDGSEAEVTNVPDADYVVQLPIPAAMKDVKLIAVAATNEENIATPVEVTIENGYLRFSTKYLTTFTILGFSEAKAAPINKVPMIVPVLFIVGGALLIGAGLLMYFFVFRKPKDDGDLPPDGGFGPDGGPMTPLGDPPPNTLEDIYSNPGSAPIPVVPPSRPDMEDIYSSDSRRPPQAPPPPAPTTPPVPVNRQTPPPDRQGGVSLGSFQNRPKNPPPDEYDDGL